MKKTIAIAGLLGTLAMGPAHAGPISFTTSPNGTPDPGYTPLDFAAPPPGVTVSFSGPNSGLQVGTTPTHAAPYLNGNGTALGVIPNTGPDADPYASSGGPVGTFSLGFAQPQTSLEFYAGSLDPAPWNVLTLLAGGEPIGSIGGDELLPGASGNQGAPGSEFVKLFSAIPFTAADFHSALPAFEVAAVFVAPAAAGPVPEPAALTLLGTSLVGLGIARHQRPARATAAA